MIAHIASLSILPVLALMTAFPVLAQGAVSSRYTSVNLASSSCKQEQGPAEGSSCPGLAGWTLNVGFPAFGATLNFTHEKLSRSVIMPADGRQVSVDDLAGKTTTIEWRGTMRGGIFEPHAAIIRVLVLDAAQRQDMIEKGAPSPLAKRAQILVVTRLGREGSCLIAYVDAQGNSKPNELARAAADKAAQSTTCPVANVDIVGVKTPVLVSYMQ